MNIPFNKPHLTEKKPITSTTRFLPGSYPETAKYTQLCQNYLKERYGFGKCLLTTSCTDALEMAAILVDIREGDEVIMPSYTFVSTSNAFILRGAKIVFADSRKDHPGMDESSIEALITAKNQSNRTGALRGRRV
jgi:dTDP-4-amino-4,6-dideoxygalactose transaminase